MTQNGIVTAVAEDGMVLVAVQRQTACGGNCASCGECVYKSELTAKANNLCGAKIGDHVTLESQSGALIGAAALVYLLPIAAFLVGYGISAALGAREGVSIAVSIASLLLGCGLVSVLAKRRKKTIRFDVIRIDS